MSTVTCGSLTELSAKARADRSLELRGGLATRADGFPDQRHGDLALVIDNIKARKIGLAVDEMRSRSPVSSR